MELKMLEVDIPWPENSSVLDLRSLIVEHLRKSGQPLRWAITDIISSENHSCCRYVRVECMVVTS